MINMLIIAPLNDAGSGCASFDHVPMAGETLHWELLQSSWALIHTILAVHYANEFYGDTVKADGVLSFQVVRLPIIGTSSILLCHRDDRTGIGCVDDVEGDSENGDSSQYRFFHIQLGGARAKPEHRCERREPTLLSHR